MHDGRTPYPGAVEALSRVMALDKPVVVLTNSGKRAAPNRQRVMNVGFPAASFTTLVSSGEVAWAGIRRGTFGAPFETGARAGLIGRHGDAYDFNDLGLVFVNDWADADILLIMGSDAPRTSLDDYTRMLAPAARHGVPALCCNPDLTMLTATGLQPSAGASAWVYAERGGPVTCVGKPLGAIYEVAAMLGLADRARILAIGDSLEHDIGGGAKAGLKTALVRTGILAELDEEAFQRTLIAAPFQPDYLLPSLRW